MSDPVEQARMIQKLRGDTFSSAEVISVVGRLADEIERLYTDYGLLSDDYKQLQIDNERLQVDIAALSRALNGIANRKDFADKILKARRALEQKP